MTCTFSHIDGDRWQCHSCGRIVRSTTPNIHAECGIGLGVAAPCPPGCQLRRLLAWWGIRDDGTCGCDEFAAQMDAWGAACWNHLEEIVDHLRAAAAARGIPFIAPAARMMVARAIEAAGREVAHVEASAEKETRPDLVRTRPG